MRLLPLENKAVPLELEYNPPQLSIDCLDSLNMGAASSSVLPVSCPDSCLPLNCFWSSGFPTMHSASLSVCDDWVATGCSLTSFGKAPRRPRLAKRARSGLQLPLKRSLGKCPWKPNRSGWRVAHRNKSFIINFSFVPFLPSAGNIVDQVGEVKFLAFFVTQRVPSNDVRRTLKAFHERRMRQYGVQDIGIG